MKHIKLALLFLLLAGVVGYTPTNAQVSLGVAVRVAPFVSAGEMTTITIKVVGTTDRTVDVVLLNGMRRFDQRVGLNRRGVGIWRIAAGELSQSGASLVIVLVEGQTYHHIIPVIASQSATIDLLTSARTIPAYGEGRAMIMVLVSDDWGNMINNSDLWFNVRYPNGSRNTIRVPLNNGLGWRWIASSGTPGRLRIAATARQQIATLEMFQAAGPPAAIVLTVTPACLLSDGRDVFQLSAVVTDGEGARVADGTLVTFYWPDGQGYGVAANGVAILRLPAPPFAGHYDYWASSGDITTHPIQLTIAEDRCP